MGYNNIGIIIIISSIRLRVLLTPGKSSLYPYVCLSVGWPFKLSYQKTNNGVKKNYICGHNSHRCEGHEKDVRDEVDISDPLHHKKLSFPDNIDNYKVKKI